MPDRGVMDLSGLDRDALMARMAAELSHISGEMGTNTAGIAERSGLDNDRLCLIASGRRKMRWSEYLSILFLLWNDERGRRMVDELGLFPEQLKKAMSVNRNAHEKMSERS